MKRTLVVLLLGLASTVGLALYMSQTNAPETPATESTISESSIWFVESAQRAGLEFRHVSGFDGKRFWFPECVAGGVGLLDFDGDLDLDVYCVQGNSIAEPDPRHRNQLFRNRGDGTFENVTASAGVGDSSYGMGCACGDFNGDGHTDIYVTNVGPNVLFENQGDGTFRDVTKEAGVAGNADFSSSAVFADYDGDGNLDLFVVNYVIWDRELEIQCYAPGSTGEADYCSPNSYGAPAPDRLFQNQGNGTFRDVTSEVGVKSSYGNGLGVVANDFDNDGRLDFYVANDGMANQLWLQDEPGRFRDEALLAGLAVNQRGAAEAGMGVTIADVDGDSDPDLLVTHLIDESNTFYRNQGDWFEDATDRVQLAAPSFPFTGFGVGFGDFDQDGYLDLYVANGRVLRSDGWLSKQDPYAEPNQVFTSNSEGLFREVLPRGAVQPSLIATSRGLALGDLDGDGDLDAVVINRDASLSLLRNEASQGNWLRVRLLDSRGLEALHAKAQFTSGQRQWTRWVQPAQSYCSSGSPWLHVGLANASGVDEILVQWPDHTMERFGPLAGNTSHTLRQGTGKPYDNR